MYLEIIILSYYYDIIIMSKPDAKNVGPIKAIRVFVSQRNVQRVGVQRPRQKFKTVVSRFSHSQICGKFHRLQSNTIVLSGTF